MPDNKEMRGNLEGRVYGLMGLSGSSGIYLMTLIPATLIPRPQLCPVVEQSLTAGSVAPCQHSVVQRGQATAVLVVWRRPERQKGLTGQREERNAMNVYICVLVYQNMTLCY